MVELKERLELVGKTSSMYLFKCDEDYLKESTSDEAIVAQEEGKEVNGFKFYYKLYANGLCNYGCYAKDGKWWSSRAEVINEVFGLELYTYDVSVNHRCYGILKSAIDSINTKEAKNCDNAYAIRS